MGESRNRRKMNAADQEQDNIRRANRMDELRLMAEEMQAVREKVKAQASGEIAADRLVDGIEKEMYDAGLFSDEMNGT